MFTLEPVMALVCVFFFFMTLMQYTHTQTLSYTQPFKNTQLILFVSC